MTTRVTDLPTHAGTPASAGRASGGARRISTLLPNPTGGWFSCWYNKTTQPFGFQYERRSLFEARDVYIQVSPPFFADEVNEPVLVIHGNADSNPGALTFQSEVFFEAVRGSGGTARLVLLPFEDHGYRVLESVEHVLCEQIRWFDTYQKNAQ